MSQARLIQVAMHVTLINISRNLDQHLQLLVPWNLLCQTFWIPVKKDRKFRRFSNIKLQETERSSIPQWNVIEKIMNGGASHSMWMCMGSISNVLNSGVHLSTFKSS